MVHVEIWLGEGQQTLGARWQKGTVQVFDSYRFVSTSYGDMKYHFKSLETWLQGTCVSHCPEHEWGSSSVSLGKRSIFYPWDDQQQPAEDSSVDACGRVGGTSIMQIIDGEAASPPGGEQEDVDRALEGPKETTHSTEVVQKSSSMLKRSMESTVPAEAEQDGGRTLGEQTESIRDSVLDDSVIAPKTPKGYSIGASGDGTEIRSQVESVLVQDTRSAKLVVGDVTPSPGCPESTAPMRTLKGLQKTGRGSDNKEKIGSVKIFGELAKSTISSNKLYPRAAGGAKKKKKRGLVPQQKAASGPVESEPLDEAKETKTNQRRAMEGTGLEEKRQEDPQGPGPFFFIGGSNGAALVASYFMAKGWQRLYDPSREDYKLKWCEVKTPATYRAFREGEQLLYQIPNNKILTTKIGLLHSLREYERLMTKVSGIRGPRMLQLEDFFPETFRLDLKEERNAFLAFYKDPQLWICKPTGMNQGKGIFLLKSKESVNTLCTQLQTMDEDAVYRRASYKSSQARIVQRYIHNPLLLSGRKFDIRSYFLIASTAPYLVFFRHGYVRLTCNSYDPHSDDLTGHLTNQYMQKKNPLYNELKEDTVWTMERFNNYVNDHFAAVKGLPPDWVLTSFTKRMQQIMFHCFMAVKSKLECKMGFFDLIGCDFLIDEDFKVWFLEMNCNPALHTNCEVLKDVIPDVVNETLDLTLEIFNKCVKTQRIMPLENLRNFVPLYNGDLHELKVTSSRTSLSPLKFQRMTLSDNDELGQLALKAPENTPKKAWIPLENPTGNGTRTSSNKFIYRTVMSLSQGHLSEIISAASVPQPVKSKVKGDSSIDNSCKDTKPGLVFEDHELSVSPNRGKGKTASLSPQRNRTKDNASPPLMGKRYNTMVKSNEMIYPLHLQMKAPNTNKTAGPLNLANPCDIKELAPTKTTEDVAATSCPKENSAAAHEIAPKSQSSL
ncbi:inactive polyglycylase TTLL10 [Lissotriton helveticus]